MNANCRQIDRPDARRHLLPLLVAACLVACRSTPLAAQDLSGCWSPIDARGGKALGTLSCASASCHGQNTASPLSAGTARQESVLWLEHDPHATAARTLDSPPFRRILALVSSGREDGPPSAAVYARCAACHDPQGMALSGNDLAQVMTAPAAAGSRGISCESCHGPAGKWLSEHYRRDVSQEELHELGMTNMDNLLVRARRCASCHVGDETRDVNHDLIAAGHPPLRFELSAYHDLIRRKHWPDAERIETPEFKAQLWAAGQLAAADAALALLQSRAARAAMEHSPWPEFAEFDCFACHQRLKPAANVPRERIAPGWQPWNLALAQQLVGTQPARPPTLADAPQEVLHQAAIMRAAVQEHPLALSFFDEGRSRSPAFTTNELLRLIERPIIAGKANWSSACQELLALKAAYLTIRDEHVERNSLRSENGTNSVLLRRDIDELTVALCFGASEFEWPAFDWDGLPGDSGKQTPSYSDLPEIQAKLRELAGLLRRQSQHSGTAASSRKAQR